MTNGNERRPNLAPLDDISPDTEGSLFETLGLRGSGASLIGILIQLDTRLQGIAAKDDAIHARLDVIEKRMDEWSFAAQAIGRAGDALVAAAGSRVFWLILGIALGLGSLSIDAVGKAVGPMLIQGATDAP